MDLVDVNQCFGDKPLKFEFISFFLFGKCSVNRKESLLRGIFFVYSIPSASVDFNVCMERIALIL